MAEETEKGDNWSQKPENWPLGEKMPITTLPPPYNETALKPNDKVETPRRSFFRRALNLNPGFCPGAVEMRNTYKQKPKDDKKHRLSYRKCAHCGLEPSFLFPEAYKKDWSGYARYCTQFAFECHVSTERLNKSDRRSCVICWEDKGVFVRPMDLEEWGGHMRVHFKEEGYWMCSKAGNTTKMVRKHDCPSKTCKGVHC
ncbi:hypothetical protein BU23DRAFT_50298 [Bimuria novae-zelandiae CBS 107.79]|uniref:Uncharacterized protein n=1 Tax=Bimuria novae-zelandiae CBS 107.79 TaxID=1447943 RepID=A0A6A5UUQ9_9PLEO|nr:hypothetical protein BU23DRAFT_50298 [Bimuria novae-zelandiae CBS 107.79]